MRFKEILFCFFVAIAASSCYKDNVDVSTLNTNPWDLDFIGGDVLRIDSAYFDSIVTKHYITKLDTIDSVSVIIDSVYNTHYINTIKIVVNNSLFDDGLSEPYRLWIQPTDGLRTKLDQDTINGKHTFIYQRSIQETGVQLCYVFAISRNDSKSKGVTFCNTNPY